jgi:hypothetical protein
LGRLFAGIAQEELRQVEILGFETSDAYQEGIGARAA